MPTLTRGRLAKSVGVNLETIRYYEQRDLLPKAPRTAAGYRVFDDEAVRRLRFIKHAQALGFSLKEIKELLALRVRPRASCRPVLRQTEAKIADIDRKIRSLEAMRKALVRLARACSGRARVSSCPILESLEE